MSRNDLVLGQPQTWAIQPPSGSHNSNCCRQRHGALKKNGGLMLDRDIRRAQQGSRRYITLVEPRRMKLHIGVWSGTLKHICQTIAVALKLWKPDFGRCQIRIEAPKVWYFQPLCNLYQDSAILVHFTLKVFQGCNLYATCESFVFFSIRDVAGHHWCEMRCSVQLPYAEERGHHLCKARHGSPEFSWSANSMAMARGTSWFWCWIPLACGPWVLGPTLLWCCGPKRMILATCSQGSLKVIDVTAFVLLFSACFSDMYRQLQSIIMVKGSSVC